MDKVFSPQDIERRLYERWESRGWFAPQGAGNAYCIVIPPPNVTGTLHMGHAFQDTIMDTLTRYHRMCGDNTLWQPGTDHAGIATQMVVERQLAAEGKRRSDFSRDAFVERVWQWKEQSGGTISNQLRRLGASVDWERERFTMDPELSEAVTEVFVRLHEEGLIYRGKRLVNWDPVLLTAVSDLEVLSEEEAGHLWHLRYPLADGSGHVVVATTRPETMLGDSAVAVHPDDERYRHLIGKQIMLPLAERPIPIIGDTYVDPEFGSGCVKITPAHDFNDYEVGQRHDLPQINIFTPDAKLNDAVPERFSGLDRFEARKRVVEELDAAGLLERVQDHKLMVPRGDRSGVVIEPYLTDQWYVRIEPLAKPAIDAVERGHIRFVPENWSKTYFEWMRNIKDWCISRQLWWGHRIPAWYDAEGHVYVGRSEIEVRTRNRLDPSVTLRQDDDVLDTWFSSALWPFSTMGWPQRTPELSQFYPTSVLVTGFDIIFFWVARMIMMGLKFMDGRPPFRDVYIHGLVRDAEGQKMSKSKGNVLDPLDIVDGIELEALVAKRTSGLMQPHLAAQIEKSTRKHFPDGIPAFGTDALRFTFAALATQSRDIRFDLGRVAGNRNFCNKLWNAARYVTMMVETPPPATSSAHLGVADQWIRSRLRRTLDEVSAAFSQYRFDFAATALYEFTWYEFCDWYLELTKPVLQSDNPADEHRKQAARHTLVEVLEALLRAMHPIMPFITEEIWQRVAPLARRVGETIVLAPYPHAEEFPENMTAEAEIAWIQRLVLGVRQIRGEMDISPARKLRVLVQLGGRDDADLIARHGAYVQRLASLESMEVIDAGVEPPISATALADKLTIHVPLAGLIDPQAESDRLGKLATKTQAELRKATAKLANENFVRNAPPEVVTQERERVSAFERELAHLQVQLERVRRLTP